MSLWKITISGTAFVSAGSETDAEKKFESGNVIQQSLYSDDIEKVEGVDEDG